MSNPPPISSSDTKGEEAKPPAFPTFDVPLDTPPLTPEMVRLANEGE